MSSQLASNGIIFSIALALRPRIAWNSYARCWRSDECEADNSSKKDWHCNMIGKFNLDVPNILYLETKQMKIYINLI